jgi:MFS family permease
MPAWLSDHQATGGPGRRAHPTFDMSRFKHDPARGWPNSYKWWVVFMLWFIGFFNYADRQAIFSVFPKLKQEFGFDEVQLGLIGSAFMWLYAFGAPFAGFLADRLPRKPLILGGCLFWSGITMMTGWCAGVWQFVAVRALEGLGETFYMPAAMSLISDYHGSGTRSRALSFHQSSVYAGTILGSWWGAWFAETHGWRVGFWVFGGAGAVLAVVLFRFLAEPRRGAADRTGSDVNSGSVGETPSLQRSGEWRREIFGKPTALLLMAAFLGANCVATVFLTWTPTFLVEKFGFKLTSAGLSGSVFIHLASAVSAPLGGVLADWLARRWIAGRVATQALGLLAGAAFVAVVGLTDKVSTLLGAMAAFGFCKGLYDSNIFASLFDVVAPRARATAAGVMNMVGWGGGALGPIAVGLATKYGRHPKSIDNMSEAIAFGAIIYVVGAGLLLLVAFCTLRRDMAAGSAPKGDGAVGPTGFKI